VKPGNILEFKWVDPPGLWKPLKNRTKDKPTPNADWVVKSWHKHYINAITLKELIQEISIYYSKKEAQIIELTDSLIREYTQWYLTQKILNILKTYKAIALHEQRALLERYLMTTANMPREHKSPKWATIYRFSSNDADVQLKKELRKHTLATLKKKKIGISNSVKIEIEKNISNLLHKIKKVIKNAFKEEGEWNVVGIRKEIEKTPPKCTKWIAQVGKYMETSKDQALGRMISVGGSAATLEVLLRYAALGAYGSSWGAPFEAFKRLYEDFGVRYEGFASPLNSRLMEFEGTSFCSLFEDTDAPFGSIGSFFVAGQKDKRHNGAWMVNPPYTEEILAKAAKIVLERASKDKEYEAYFMSPRWTDSEAYMLMENSKYLIDMKETKIKGEFKSEDSLGIQKTGAPTAFFAISGSSTSHRRKKMKRALSVIFETGVKR
jgi:hypothetical protein